MGQEGFVLINRAKRLGSASTDRGLRDGGPRARKIHGARSAEQRSQFHRIGIASGEQTGNGSHRFRGRIGATGAFGQQRRQGDGPARFDQKFGACPEQPHRGRYLVLRDWDDAVDKSGNDGPGSRAELSSA